MELREFQKQALNVLEKGWREKKSTHLVCIAATGSGKSMIYERYAQGTGKRTLLITPLIALARQQKSKLQSLGLNVGITTGGNSDPPPSASRDAIWIASPEALENTKKAYLLKQWKPNFLVVDECHCIYEWGDDFRPSFRAIPQLVHFHQIPQSLWLTATFPQEDQKQLAQALVPQTLTQIGNFKLPASLRMIVQKLPMEERIAALGRFLSVLGKDEYGIIFVPTRALTERVAKVVRALGKEPLVYHAGFSREEREITESQVLEKKGKIVISTSAFGMGMDYAHLSFVVLWQPPASLLSLVQMCGRVGRQKLSPAHALIFWSEGDFASLEWMTQNSNRKRLDLKAVLSFLRSQECRAQSLERYFGASVSKLCNQCDFCHIKQIQEKEIKLKENLIEF